MHYCPECGSEKVLSSTRRNAWRNLMRALGYHYYLCDDCYTRFRARPGDIQRPPQVTPPPPAEPEPEFEPVPPAPAAAPPEIHLEPIPEPEPEFMARPAPEPLPEPVWDPSPRQPDLDLPPPDSEDEFAESRPRPQPWFSAGLLAKACAGLAVVLGVAALFYWYRLSLAPPPPGPSPQAAARMKITAESPAAVVETAPAIPGQGHPAGGALPGQGSIATTITLPALPSTTLTTTTQAPPPPPPPVAAPPPPPAPAARPAAPAPARAQAAKPAPKPAAKAGPAKTSPGKAPLALQFGAFSEPARAKALADKLTRKGFKVYLVQSNGDSGRKLTKVRYGAYANLDQAHLAQKEVKAKTGLETVVVKNGRN